MSAQLHSRFIDLPDDADAIYEQLYDLGVTDGFPVIPPTDARVEKFIAASGRTADSVVAIVPPLEGPATIEKIAINAVMAGCRPEYMPVLIAALEAIAEPQWNLLGAQTTTNPVAPLIILNGPIRQQLDINCGRGALGPGRRSNATIGRALRLILLNVGGAIPGDVDKSTLGMPGKYTMCLGELEEESPWDPLHVELGFKRGQSVVTVASVQGTDNTFVDWRKAESIFRALASSMSSLAANNTFRGAGNPVLFLTPGHARLLADQGFSKLQVQQELYERSKIPESALPDEVSEVQDEDSRNMVDGFNMIVARPEDIYIVVAGGPEAYHVCYCAGFGDWAVSKPITTAPNAPA